jgi:hypothetical protein
MLGAGAHEVPVVCFARRPDARPSLAIAAVGANAAGKRLAGRRLE